MKFIELFCHEQNKSVIVNLNQIVNIHYGKVIDKSKDDKFFITLETVKDEQRVIYRSAGDMTKMLDNVRKACGLCEGISSWKNPMPARGF